MSYARFFMPLTCEAKGYEFKGRIPAGRCIVETRDNTIKLSLWAQDLKHEARYNIYLIFSHSNGYAGVLVGNLLIDTKGKGETRKDISSSQLHGASIVNIVATAVVAQGEPGIVSPLCGYKDTPLLWKSGFYTLDKEPVVIKQEPIKKDAEIESISEEIPKDSMEEEPIKENDKPISNQLQETQDEDNLPIEILHVEAVPVEEIPPEEPPTETTPLPENPAPPSKTKLDSTKDILALEHILSNNPPIEPFENLSRQARWVLFKLDDKVPMPPHRKNLLDEPFVREAYSSQEYMILGTTTDGGPQKYIIGVPKAYDPNDRQQAKELGFSQFKCPQSQRAKRGEHGYWLMFINV